MEKDCKRKMKEKRSPLQNLNGLPFHKRISKNSSNLSSSAYAAKISSNSSSSYSSSNSRFNLHKKANAFSNLAESEPKSKALLRSKENEVSKKQNFQKCDKNQSRCLTRREDGQNHRKPIYKNGRSSKLSSVQGNPESRLKKGPQEFRAKTKNFRQNGSGKLALELIGASNSSNSYYSDNCTPVGSLDSLRFSSSDSVIRDSVYEGDNGNCGSDSKTPPVEASLSPEINCHSHSKLLVLKSEETPVCYGAGHLVSGVADKRKCRRRGSLRGGSEKLDFFDNERGDENVANDSIPLLAEGLIRWHLSPCKEVCEDLEIDCINRLDQCRMVYDHDKSSCIGSGSVGNVANKRRDTNVVQDTEIQGLLEPSSYNLVESLLVTSPIAADSSKLSAGSLSSGNVIQTPDSDIGSRLDVDQSKFVWPELDSTTESLEGVKLSRRNEMSMWCGTDLGFRFQDSNVDSVSSSTLGNLSLSQMRISWRDGTLRCTSVENDEFDCCCILSDDDGEIETYNKGGIGSDESKENEMRMGNGLSPVVLDYEPCISSRGKERQQTAESICTDGGGLVASDDSDWTYFRQDNLDSCS